MTHWYEPITLALHRHGPSGGGKAFRYLTPTQTGLDLVFECETCSGEGELEHRKPVGRIDEESWMEDCPDCEDGKREFVKCHDCGAELFHDTVAGIVRHEPRVYYYSLCGTCLTAELAEAKEEDAVQQVILRVRDLATGEVVKTLGPMSESKADKVTMGLLRQIDPNRFCVDEEVTP